MAAACVVLATTIVWQHAQTPSPVERPRAHVLPQLAQRPGAPARGREVSTTVPEGEAAAGVPRLSPAEVQAFLNKMAAFRASHPEFSTGQSSERPVSLVGYRPFGPAGR